jgi:hypothetical protein
MNANLDTLRLPRSANAWGNPDFPETLKAEIAALPGRTLPLQEGLRRGSVALDASHRAILIASAAHGPMLRAKVGLAYASVIAGCSCADDPTPLDEESEYCVVEIDIDRASGDASVRLLADES